MMHLICNGQYLYWQDLEWAGTDSQCSRTITFTLPSNPYDKEFPKVKIELGDTIRLYHGKKPLFVGTITARERKAEIGTVSYTAMDFMHFLLKSSGTYKFKNSTPEMITEKICRDMQVKTKNLAPTGIHVKKIIFDDESLYDMIVSVYRKAYAETGKVYMPVMDREKVSVIVKGESSGVILQQGENITAAIYTDTTDQMVNLVKIYNDSHKLLGQVRNEAHLEKYGIYQKTYVKESGVSAKKKAEAMLQGITKTASVEAIGDIRAVSGYSIEILDKPTGLKGTFYITADTHRFESGVHTMSLELAWKVEMEGQDSKNSNKKQLSNGAKCYYLDGSTYYHSYTRCPSCKGKRTNKSTVREMKQIKIEKGENKGRRKFKPCKKCWVV